MPYEGGSSSNGTAERIIPIHMEPRSPIRTPISRTAPTNGTATPPNGTATPRSACPERIIPIFREGTPPATTNGSAAAVKRQQVPTVIGFKHSYFSPISSNSSDRHGGTAAKPIVVRKLSPLSPKHIVGPVGSNGVKPAPPLKPEHLKSPPMSPVPSEEAAYSGSNRSSPLQLLPLQRFSSSLPAAADTESGTALTSPEEKEDKEVTFPSIAAAKKETDSLRTSAPEDLEDTLVCEPPPESDMPEAESLPPTAAEDSEPASLVTENSEPVSLSEEADQLPVPVHQQNGHFVELLPDEQER
jgi:hypothetical protein